MDEPRRIAREDVARILEASGVRALTHDSNYGETIRAILTAFRLVRYALPWDRALVYAGLIETMEAQRLNVPWTTEQIFFDDLYGDLHGVQQHMEEVRAEGGQVAEGARDRKRVPESDRDSGGERGGRDRRVEIVVPERGQRTGGGGGDGPGSGEVPQGSEPVEGSGRGGRGDNLPF